MERHVIRESDIARFGAHLRGEEREAGTTEKYRRDVGAFAAWAGGRDVTRELAGYYTDDGHMGPPLHTKTEPPLVGARSARPPFRRRETRPGGGKPPPYGGSNYIPWGATTLARPTSAL